MSGSPTGTGNAGDGSPIAGISRWRRAHLHELRAVLVRLYGMAGGETREAIAEEIRLVDDELEGCLVAAGKDLR